MNQKRTRNLLVALGVIAVLATAGVAVFALQGTQQLDGVITIMAPSYTAQTGLGEARDELYEAILDAQALKNSTDTQAGGAASHWASQPAHDTFQTGIEDAQGVLARAGLFRVGDEFDVIVRIDQNQGFSGMLFKLNLPQRLELVAVTPGAAFGAVNVDPDDNIPHPTFFGGPGWIPEAADGRERFSIHPPRQTGQDIITGFAGRTDGNFDANGTLFTYTLRVTPGGADYTTGNITISFGTTEGADRPVGNRGNDILPLTMSLQGEVMDDDLGTTVNLGRVHIRQ